LNGLNEKQINHPRRDLLIAFIVELSMTRRKDKKLKEQGVAWRKSRIDKLISRGWIPSESEIPRDAIPVDPDLINLSIANMGFEGFTDAADADGIFRGFP